MELLVVLAILALLLGLGLPSYLDYGSNQRVRTAARTLASDLQVARQEALRRRATVTVGFSSADRSCAENGRTASYTVTQPAALVKRTCLPRNVTWLSLPQRHLVFQSSGGVPAGMTLWLQSLRTGATHMVAVSAETGVITHDAR